jgi:hypothetical protein
MSRITLPILIASTLAALACAPALDWRDFRPEGTPLKAQFPCRPAGQERQVALAGRQVALRIYACQAEGLVFALGHADVGDPATVEPALQAMLQAGKGNIDGRVVDDQPSAVPGMTPQPQARSWRLAGQLGDGRAHESHLMVFSYGTLVAQGTVGGPALNNEQVRMFLRSIEVRP